MRRTGLMLAALGLTIVGLAGAASSAHATFHLMKVREISPGNGTPNTSYVEVQMYAPFQQFLSPAKIVVCNDICSVFPREITGFSTVPNGNNQDTVLFGDSAVASKDFNADLDLDSIEAGGAVCYVSEPGYTDCVSWGNFNNNSALTSRYDLSADPGTPAPALTDGMALRRSISAGCPTTLEASDDTNDSAADFAVTSPNPRTNSTTPTEVPCGGSSPPGGAPSPNAPGAKKKKKCKKHKKSSASPGTGSGTSNPPAYSAKKKKCKKKRK